MGFQHCQRLRLSEIDCTELCVYVIQRTILLPTRMHENIPNLYGIALHDAIRKDSRDIVKC